MELKKYSKQIIISYSYKYNEEHSAVYNIYIYISNDSRNIIQ